MKNLLSVRMRLECYIRQAVKKQNPVTPYVNELLSETTLLENCLSLSVLQCQKTVKDSAHCMNNQPRKQYLMIAEYTGELSSKGVGRVVFA